VLSVASSGEATTAAGSGRIQSALFDATVPAGAGAGELAAIIREGAAIVGVRVQGDAVEEVKPPPDSEAGMGDTALVESLLKGRDVLPVALSVLGLRIGPVEFVPRDAAAEQAAPTKEVEGVAGDVGDVRVEREGVFFGWLTGANVDEEAGAWLAGWLRLRDQQQQLRTAAFTDPLTGAWNRRYFERFLATCLESARARHRHVMVLVFDIDDFKRYNDAYGHEAGDEILIEAVRLMRSVIRPSDRVCRIGGDEFAVVFHDPEGPRKMGSINAVSVMEIAQRFRNQILQHRFPKLAESSRGSLTISGGMATFPWDGATPAALLAKADQLALEAKRNGKNAITFGPGMARACEQSEG